MLCANLALALYGLALASPPALTDDAVTLVFGGDVALGRVVDGAIRVIGDDAPLVDIAPILTAADLAIVNLETVLWDGSLPRDGIRLIARSSAAQHLADAGIDLVSVANNHALDAGVPGLATTLSALDTVGLVAVGTRVRHLVRTVRGVRIAFTAITDRTNATTSESDLRHIAWLPTRTLMERLPAMVGRFARDVPADHHVVLIHWGRELAKGPTPAQRELARALIEAGATLVIGHHSHTVQELEHYQGGLIAYSLGNLNFDLRPPSTREGALLEVRLDANRVIGSEMIPTYAGPDDRPQRNPPGDSRRR